MLHGAVELVEKRDARRAGTFRKRQPCRLPGGRPGPLIARVARKHEAVDRQRVLARREELGQPHIGRSAVCSGALEDVVLGNLSAGWEIAPVGGDRLHRSTQLDLLLQELLARRSVLGRLAGKRDAHGPPFYGGTCTDRSGPKSKRSEPIPPGRGLAQGGAGQNDRL